MGLGRAKVSGSHVGYPRLPVLGPAPMFAVLTRGSRGGFMLHSGPVRATVIGSAPGACVLHFTVSEGGRFFTDRGMTISDGFSIGLASLQRDLAAGRSLPPVERWNPPHCGDIDIRIARNGTWYHQGTPFARRELVRLFSTILRKDADGYHLVTPGEKMRIRVDDAPFVAVLLRSEGEGPQQRLIFTTNVGDETIAGEENPIRVENNEVTGEPSPYVHVRRGLEALISRSVFYQLADLAVPGAGDILGVWSGGVFFPLGSAR